MTHSPDVLIAGAGPTGLAAAVVLREYGVGVRIVDAAPEPFVGSRGKGVQPRTLESLDQFGLADRLIGLGRLRMPVRRYADRYDRAGVERPLHANAAADPTTPWSSSLLVPQWRTEQVLRERLSELGVEVEWGSAVTGLTDGGDHVDVELTGPSGGTVRTGWVVGADGGRSIVRRLIGVDFLGETDDGVRMLLGDVRLAGLDRDAWHQWSTERHPFLGLCPLPSTDTFQLQDAVPIGHDLPEPTDAAFQSAIDDVTHGVRVLGSTWRSTWRLNVRMVETYRRGRVFLAGDAAHVHSPAGGQGMNTGIQDAINLAWKLGVVIGGGGTDETLLDTYEAERLPIAADVLGFSSSILDRPPGDRTGPDRDRSLQLGITYRDPRDETPGPIVGDRAPDAPLQTSDGGRVRLYELLRGPQPTTLGFGIRPDGPGRVLEIGADILDPDGDLARIYRAAPGETVTIRPDRYVGARS